MSKIYLVNQTQPAEGYYETTIYVCSTFERAQKYARRLNKEYGEGCVFDDNWDFVEYDMRCEPHYYTVADAEIDEPMVFPDESVSEELEQIQGATISDMKCPFCKQELEIGGVDGILRGCPKCRNLGTEMLWQELIRTHKALDVAWDTLKKIKEECYDTTDVLLYVNKALEQITAEQKDVK